MVARLDDLLWLCETFDDLLYNQVGHEVRSQGDFEESVLVTLMGENYKQVLDMKTGEWQAERDVLDHFG